MKVIFVILTIVIAVLTLAWEMKETEAKTVKNRIAMVTEDRPAVVFIAGFDEGDNNYYANAKAYFKRKSIRLVDHKFSLAEIIQWLNQNAGNNAYGEIHIVSHSNAWRGMSLKTSEGGVRVSTTSLETSVKTQELPRVIAGIDGKTKLIFHSCGLGENKGLLSQLKTVFTAVEAPKVYASPYFNIFGGKYSSHYLAKPYYGFYPTAESPGPLALSKEFKSKYPKVNIDWFTAIKTRTEQELGDVYTYKFNVPVAWEFRFDSAAEVPQFSDKEALMDWLSENEQTAVALFELGIPIEKYRWRASRKGTTLSIKGKSSVLCVLQPILHPKDPEAYRSVVVSDIDLYQIL